jgi:phosphoribosylformylglycinamidine cyclo-ligase
MEDRYLQRGVSAEKEDVHQAIKKLSQGLYPGSFCKIFPDVWTNNSEQVMAMSADGSGTKSVLAYLYWKETGDLSVWEGIAQDALVMNTDDLMCIGATNDFLFSSVINRNKKKIPAEVIAALIEGSRKFCENMEKQGIRIHLTGGETADLGDAVRTLTVDACLTTRIAKQDLILTQNIKPGQVIIGFASDGQTSYEQEYNSGISSNGLTSARHDVLAKIYAKKYPESYDPDVNPELIYCGSKSLTESLPGTPLTIGKALLSPTRTFLPLVARIMQEKPGCLKGLINNTGGALSKVLHYVNRVRLVKNNIPPIPPVFELIRQESNTPLPELFKVLNCGIRLEAYVEEKDADAILQMANNLHIRAFVMGHVEESEKALVSISYNKESWEYTR